MTRQKKLPPLDDPRAIEAAIKASPEATESVLRYLDSIGVEHSGQISGATLGALCEMTRKDELDDEERKKRNIGRTWRMWISGQRPFPPVAGRLLRLVAFGA